MADSTLLGVVVGGTIGLASGALSGYIAGRFNVEASKRTTEAEAARLRAQHDRADLEHRQGVYHSFLNALSRVTKAATAADVQAFREAATFDPDPEGKIVQLFLVQVGEVRDQLNGILLFGTPEVEAAARPFERLFREAEAVIQAEAVIGALSAATLDNENSLRDLLDAWDSRSRLPEWRDALARLKEAMRHEVAPGP